MKISIMSLCRNEAPFLPWYLRCYESFADEILVWDDHSTDGTRELLRAHPLVKLYDCHWVGLDEDKSLKHFYSMLASRPWRHDDGFTCVVDIDELLYWPGIDQENMAYALQELTCDIVRTAGFNMFTEFSYNACLPSPRDELPFEFKQLWEIHPMGVYSQAYSKPVVVRYGCQPRWTRGRHQLEHCNPIRSEQPLLKLLHYGFRFPSYVTAKNANNLARCVDKSFGWTCQPTYKGIHSPEWVASELPKAINVLEAPMPNIPLQDDLILP